MNTIPERRRIAFFHPDLGIGGAERLVIDAAVGLQDIGHKVTIFTSHCDPAHCFDEARDGISESLRDMVDTRTDWNMRYTRRTSPWKQCIPTIHSRPFCNTLCHSAPTSSRSADMSPVFRVARLESICFLRGSTKCLCSCSTSSLPRSTRAILLPLS